MRPASATAWSGVRRCAASNTSAKWIHTVALLHDVDERARR